MTPNIIAAGVAAAVVLSILIASRRLHSRYAADVYTSKKSEATYGVGFGVADDGLNDTIRDRIFKRDGGKCQITGERGIQGQPDSKLEYLKVAIGSDELEVGHIIPYKLCGPTEDWNLMLMKKSINRKFGNKITPYAEKLCRERGEKIYSVGIKKVKI